MALLLAIPARAQPDSPQGGAKLAREIEQQFRRGEPSQALQKLEQALAAEPGDANLKFLKAVILSETGRNSEAMALLEGLTQAFPELPEPYNNLAVLMASAGQLAPARTLLETALRLDPAYRTAHENLGDVYLRLAQQAYAAALGSNRDAVLQNKLKLAQELSQAFSRPQSPGR